MSSESNRRNIRLSTVAFVSVSLVLVAVAVAGIEITDVAMEPTEPNETSILNCTYEYSTSDGETLNTTNYTWYRNQDGLNNWTELGIDNQTLRNNETRTWFSTRDEMKCSVNVTGSQGNISLENSSTAFVDGTTGNLPRITNHTANTSESTPAREGDTVQISFQWNDSDSSLFDIKVCEDINREVDQYSNGSDLASFGNSPLWLYSNESGEDVEKLYIKIDRFNNTTSTVTEPGRETAPIYDIYVYNQTAPGETATDNLVDFEHDVSLTNNRYTEIKFDRIKSMDSDVLGFKVCIDDDNDYSCDDNHGRKSFISVNESTGTYEARDKDGIVYDPSIRVEYNNQTGCFGSEYCMETGYSDSGTEHDYLCNYSVSDNDSWKSDYEIKVYNGTNTSLINSGHFYVNSRPKAENVHVTPDPPTPYSEMTCEYTYNSSDPGTTRDSENESAARFRWYLNDTEIPTLPDARTISAEDYNLNISDRIKCSVRVEDDFGFQDDSFVNSTEVIVGSLPSKPKIWSLPDVTGEEKIHLIGYIEVDNVDYVVADALSDEDNFNKSNSTSDLKNTELLEENKLTKDFEAGENHIKVYDNASSGFSVGNFVRVEDQIAENFRYYEIINKSEILGEGRDRYYTLTIEPHLDEPASKGTPVYAYNNSYPNNWFNLSLPLWEGNNTIRVRGMNPDDGWTYEDRVYRDPRPLFDLSEIPDGTVETSPLLNFTVEDNNELDLETLELEVTNETGFSRSYGYGSEITCNGTDAETVDNISCAVNVSADEGNNTLQFSVSDVSGAEAEEERYLLVEEDRWPEPEVHRKSEVTKDTSLLVNWTAANVSYLQYAVGSDKYPSNSFDSVLEWRNATEEAIEDSYLNTISLGFENRTSYYIHVRYKKYGWDMWSEIGVSDSILYIQQDEPTTYPTSVEVTPTSGDVYNDSGIEVSWTESTQNSSYYEIDHYEYALGTSEYPDSGWNSETNGWINNSLDTTACVDGEFENKETYYMNVKAVDTGDFESEVSSSSGITYYDGRVPNTEVVAVDDDTEAQEGWLDEVDNGYTNISIHGNRNMTCYYSPYDRIYEDMENYTEGGKCDASGEWGINLTCQIPDLEEGLYEYHVACKDTDGRTQDKEENADVTFTVDHQPPSIDIYHPEELNYAERKGKFGPDDLFLVNLTDYPGGIDSQNFTILNNSDDPVESGRMSKSTSNDYYSNNYTYDWDTEEFDSGNYTFVLEAGDSYGHNSTEEVKFELDKIPPSITTDVFNNVSGRYFHDDFNITTELADYVFAAYGVFGESEDPLSVETDDSGGYDNEYNWTSLINTSDLPDDKYILNYYANDSVGNEINDSLEFYVDKHAWFNESKTVPDLSWIEDNDNMKAIDLDNYFENVTNVSTVYSHSDPRNITVDIHEREILPLSQWSTSSGTSSVTFDVTDESAEVNVTSNGPDNVTLYQTLSVNNSTEYQFEALHRANNTDPSEFKYSVVWKEYNGTDDLVRSEEQVFNASDSWREVSSRHRTTENTTDLEIVLKQNPLVDNVSTRSQWEETELYRYYEHPHHVSFSPDDNWHGTRNITFTANDSYGVAQDSNEAVLTVLDDYCNPPENGTWDLDHNRTALCNPADEPLMDGLNGTRVLYNTTLNMTNSSVAYQLNFTDNSTGNLRNSDFNSSLYIKGNSTVTAWNCTFDEVFVSKDSSFTVYDSPNTINKLTVIGNDNLELDNVSVRELVFKKSRGNITDSRINQTKIYVNSTGSLNIHPDRENGLLDTVRSRLNLTGTEVDLAYVSVLKRGDLAVTDSKINSFLASGNVSLENTSLTNLFVFNSSRIESLDSEVGKLSPYLRGGQAVIGGNMTVEESDKVENGELTRFYPAYFYNHNSEPLENLTTSHSPKTDENGYTELSLTFNSTFDGESVSVEGMEWIEKADLTSNTPFSFSSRMFDQDGDGIPRLNDTDDDNDGIPDTQDNITGDASWLTGNLNSPGLTINGSSDLSKNYDGVYPVRINDSYGNVTEFNWSFDESKLELYRFDINKSVLDEDRQGLSVNGYGPHSPKTVYLNRTNYTAESVCIKDSDSGLSDITSGCSAEDETYLQCPGTKDGYNCTTSGTYWKITGLEHSSVAQMSNAAPEYEDPSPSDGATGVSTSPTLSVEVSDRDGTGMNVSFFVNTSSGFVELGNQTNVDDGTRASLPWDGLNESQTYSWYVNVTDGEETVGSPVWNFTTGTEDDGSGGGSGGGGGSSMSYTSSPTEMTVSVEDGKVNVEDIGLDEGERETIEIDYSEISLNKLTIRAREDISKGEINITKVSRPSIPEPTKQGYELSETEYWKIESNLEGKLSNISFYFTHERAEDVSLWEYEGGWKEHPAKRVGTSGDLVQYRASSTDFSYFVVAEARRIRKEPDGTDQPEGPVCGDLVCEGEENATNCPEDCDLEEKPKEEGLPWLWIVGVLVAGVLAGVVGLVFWRRKSTGPSYQFKKGKKGGKTTRTKRTSPSIGTVLNNPGRFVGREVKLSGNVYPSRMHDQGVLYKISDRTGSIRGIAQNADYIGQGTVEGTVKMVDGEPHIYF